VIVDTGNIHAILGPDAGVPEARVFLRNALGTNSRATLGHAKTYAEARARGNSRHSRSGNVQ
jgi:aromatase